MTPAQTTGAEGARETTRIAELERENERLRVRIVELERENARLRKANASWREAAKL